jgi:hypothetical protein
MDNATLNAVDSLTLSTRIPEDNTTGVTALTLIAVASMGPIHVLNCEIPDGDISNIKTAEDFCLGFTEVLSINDTFGSSGRALKKHIRSESNRENLAFVCGFRGVRVVGAGVNVDMPWIGQAVSLAN